MGSKHSSAKDKFGETEAPHYILINFCGGWGYTKLAVEVAEKLMAKYPG